MKNEFALKTFTTANRISHCSACSKDKLRGRKMCAGHLEKARLFFRSWSATRRAAGKCCWCNKKSFNGWLRCKIHTLYNRAKCAAWMERHPDHGHKQWIERKKKFLANGLCVCKAHNRLPPGFRRCDSCRPRQRGYGTTATQSVSL